MTKLLGRVKEGSQKAEKRSPHQSGGVDRRPMTSDTTAKIKNTTNKILAMSEATEAVPNRPSAPAKIETSRKISAMRSIGDLR